MLTGTSFLEAVQTRQPEKADCPCQMGLGNQCLYQFLWRSYPVDAKLLKINFIFDIVNLEIFGRMKPGRKEKWMKKHRKMAAFLLSVVAALTAAVSPAAYAAGQDTGFSDAAQETSEMETQAMWLSGEEPLTKKATARNTVLLTENSDSSAWFATKDELLTSYDTDESTSQLAKKVYFGQNGSGAAQEWWIVGQDSAGGGLVLFAASPLIDAVFSSSTGSKVYGGDVVYEDHYGASDLYNTLKGLETNTDYFSAAEQELMLDTTVWTEDKKNGKNYSTTEKLYVAYGDLEDDQYVTVGTNSSSSLNDGLRVDLAYWGMSSNIFWLRATFPNPNYSNYALVGCPGDYVDCRNVNDTFSVVPAFQLNLSSVLFASAASAASSNGTLATGDMFTLRYTDTSIGSAQINIAKDSVQVTDAVSGTYLVVQNSEGAYAVSVSGSASISASAVTINGEKLTSFKNCKVWLEKAGADELIKAALATNEGWEVTVQAGNGMTRETSSGAEEQSVKAGEAITAITYKAAEGYYFPDDYSVAGTNGLKITVADDNGSITISGTPVADTALVLPGTSQKRKANTPEVRLEARNASTITVTALADTDTYGEARYSIDQGATWQESNVFAALKAGQTYTVSAKYLGNGIYTESETGTLETATESASYIISIPQAAQAGGDSVDIEVNKEKEFDLGYNGQVNVKVKNDGVVSADGIVTLTRQNDPDNKTVTSAMYVDGEAFTDIAENVAVFKTINDPAVSISFGTPEEKKAGNDIPGGEYSGTVTFEISYSEP